MSRIGVPSTVALCLLAVTGLLVHLPRPRPPAVTTADLVSVPLDLRDWRGRPGVPEEAMPLEDAVGQRLERTYEKGARTVWVVVGYYPDQTARSRPPAQRLVYPSHGWTGIETRTRSMLVPGSEAGSLSATQVLMRRERRGLAVLYWYQLGARSVAGDHWYRARLLYNRLVHNRADVALVRIMSPVPADVSVEAVLAAQEGFARVFYPELVRRLPPSAITARVGESR